MALTAASTPAPTPWQHDSACAWTAAWLTLRDREFLGQRELISQTDWSGQLRWRERENYKRRGHRPDLIGYVGDEPITIEVELAGKSRARLDAILALHRGWITAGKSISVLYVCGDEERQRRVRRAGDRQVLGGRLRTELLDTIIEQTTSVFETRRITAAAESPAASSPILRVHGT